MNKNEIKVPPANGHYSQSVSHGDLVFISGQLPIKDGIVPSTLAEEVRSVLRKIEAILIANGCVRSDVLQSRVYIVGIEKWSEVNEIYADFFGNHKPARAIVPVSELHFGCSIEIEAIARKT